MSLEINPPGTQILPPDRLNYAEQIIELVARLIAGGETAEEVRLFIPTDEDLQKMHLSERKSDHQAGNARFWIRTRGLQKEGLIPNKTYVFGEPIDTQRKG